MDAVVNDSSEIKEKQFGALMKSTNHTSKFVALLLLLTLLDDNETKAVRLWESLELEFLDRLMLSGIAPNGMSMIDLER